MRGYFFNAEDAEGFLGFLNRAVPLLDHAEKNYKEQLEKLSIVIDSLSKALWLKEMVDPINPSWRSTLLHAALYLVMCVARSDEVCLSLLACLVHSVPVAHWEVVLPTEESASHSLPAVFKTSPRESLFELCQKGPSGIYFAVLDALLRKSSVSDCKNDFSRYLAAIKNTVLHLKGFISTPVASILLMVAKNAQNDFGLWFQTESIRCGDIDMLQGPSLFALMVRNVIAKIKQFKSGVLGQRNEHIMGVMAVNHLFGCLYYIAKKVPPVFWSEEKADLFSLDALIDLVLVGFEHDILVKIVQHVVSHLSEAAKSSVSNEKKEALLGCDELEQICLMLTTSVCYPVDLCESFELFSDTCSAPKFLLPSALDIKKCIDDISQSEPQKITLELIPSLQRVDKSIWSKIVKNETRDEQMKGLSFFHALILLLRRKLTEPEQLCLVFDILCGFAATKKLWDWMSTEKSDCVKRVSLHSENTPYRVIWNLCQQENGYYFLPVLVRILREISKERWQSEPFVYVGLAIHWLQKKKKSLTLSVVDFLRFVVAEFSEDSSVFFQAIDFNLSGKKTSKVKQSAVCVLTLLVDTLNDLLKNAQNHLSIVKPLLASLASIVEQSASEDWEPIMVDDDAPLNALVKLVLNHPVHADVLAVFSSFLKKATPASLESLSVELVRQLLLVAAFSKNKLLLAFMESKKSKLKKSAPPVKPAPKQVAKAQALPPQQKAKSVASKTPFFVEKPKLLENPEVILNPVHLPEVLDSQSPCVALPEQVNDDEVVFFLSPPKPPARWADDVESQQPVTFFSTPVEKAQTFSKMGKLGEAFWQAYVEQIEQCVRK